MVSQLGEGKEGGMRSQCMQHRMAFNVLFLDSPPFGAKPVQSRESKTILLFPTRDSPSSADRSQRFCSSEIRRTV